MRQQEPAKIVDVDQPVPLQWLRVFGKALSLSRTEVAGLILLAGRSEADAHGDKRDSEKLGDDAGNPAYFFTEPRVGYRMKKGAGGGVEYRESICVTFDRV